LSIGVFYGTWASIVEIWGRTKTYTHGFVIAPISLWLIWTQRHHWLRLKPTISYFGLLPIIAGGLLWLAANLSHVLVVEQLAVVIMLVGALWLVLGNTVTYALLFPLSFLFFMVPVGEDLVPPLIEFTSTFTVNLLRMTGIPVYREGNFFTLTSGSWSVIEACSGINYLIASITLGFVYAYLNYSSYWKRALFLLVSIIVPIIANGLRAYMIVMMGHLSNMTIAVGVDHLIYGGVFFSFVILLVFYLGSFWRDPPFTPVAAFQPEGEWGHDQQKLYLGIAAMSIFFMVWPLSHSWLSKFQSEGHIPSELIRASFDNWHKVDGLESNPVMTRPWEPYYDHAVDQLNQFYSDGQETIGIHLASFGKERQGRELVNSLNTLINPKYADAWRIIDYDTVTLATANRPQIIQSVLSGNGKTLLAFEWYQIGRNTLINSYEAKLMQLIKRLTADSGPELKIVVWKELTNQDMANASAELKAFSTHWLSQTHSIPPMN